MDIEKSIQDGESETIEFKQSLSDVPITVERAMMRLVSLLKKYVSIKIEENYLI